MVFTEVRRTREQEEGLRTSLPYSLDRRDVHWSQSTSRDVRMPVTTSDFITRMTPREQPRIEQDLVTRTRMTREDSPTWIEYQRRHADELDDGRRALERIASGAAYISDEPYIYTGPRSLLVGRQDKHAVRRGPQTRKCDNASQAGTSHGVIGQVLNVAGQRSDESHNRLHLSFKNL